MGKKRKLKKEPVYRIWRYIAGVLLGLGALTLVAGLVFVIWGVLTYDNIQGPSKNPGRIPWLIGVCLGGGGGLISFIGASCATFDRHKWGKSDKMSTIVMVLVGGGLLEFIASMIVWGYRR